MLLPKMFQVRQQFETLEIGDIQKEIENRIRGMQSRPEVRAGQSVAVACSSRGIAEHAAIVYSTVKFLKQMELEPFIIPAMGSHGGGTSEGQKKILELSGITQQSMGVPIRSSMETVIIGHTSDKIPVFMDKQAAEADWIVPINRIKSHTMFNGEVESGLMKMLAIGLGKKDGPAIYHKLAFEFGLEHVIRNVGFVIMSARSVLFGIGVVENAYGRPAMIGVFGADELERKEIKYLCKAKALEARLPLQNIDVLIIDEMGKDISGAGIDCNVIGRIDMPLCTGNPITPKIKRIVVCDLTAKSEGNAIGVGLADFITQRLFDKIDREVMNVNALTASDPEHARIPMVLLNDQQAISAAMATIGMIQPEQIRLVHIKNTKRLEKIIVSERCIDDVKKQPGLIVEYEPREIVFDNAGNMQPMRSFR